MDKIQLFENQKIRTAWDTETEEWYFSVQDNHQSRGLSGVGTGNRPPDTRKLRRVRGYRLRVILWAFGIGSAMVAVAGILIAFDTDMRPTMGFNWLLYGVVAMIIGGVGSNWGLVGGALLLATAQHLAAYYIGSQWMDAVAYIILILFLIAKPLGFSGKRLKKIEI